MNKNPVFPIAAATLGLALMCAAAPACGATPDDQVVKALLAQSTGLNAADIRDNFDQCDSGVTLKMNICQSYRLAKEDLRLNAVYADARQKARRNSYEQNLLKAQRAWIAYRDSECAMEGKAGAGGGTAEGLFVLACRTELTRLQADRLASGLQR